VWQRVEGRLCAGKAGTTRGEIAVQYTLALALARLIDAVGQHHGASIGLLIRPDTFIRHGLDAKLAMSQEARAFVRMIQDCAPRGSRADEAGWRAIHVSVEHETQVSVETSDGTQVLALQTLVEWWACGFEESMLRGREYLLRATLGSA
jgi:hypothetical protein